MAICFGEADQWGNCYVGGIVGEATSPAQTLQEALIETGLNTCKNYGSITGGTGENELYGILLCYENWQGGGGPD